MSARWRLPLLVLAAAGAIGSGLGGSKPDEAAERQDLRTPLVEQFEMEVYDTTGPGRRLSTVHAARGYAETKRLGFLQTALVPTLELEEVSLERRRTDGTWTQRHLPTAIVEWDSKTLATPTGHTIAALD